MDPEPLAPEVKPASPLSPAPAQGESKGEAQSVPTSAGNAAAHEYTPNPATGPDVPVPAVRAPVTRPVRPETPLSVRVAQEAVRAEAPQPAAARLTQNVQLRFDGGENMPEVNIQVLSRAGQVHVAVRTADDNLSAGMRRDLSQLVDRLETSGYVPETWAPRGMGENAGGTGAGDGSAPGGPGDQRWAGARDSAGDGQQQRSPESSTEAYAAGDGQRRRHRPRWMDVFDNLHGKE
jgi:hypothetical protein